LKPVSRIGEEPAWRIPDDGEEREMGLLHEGSLTSTVNMSAGSVRIPVGRKQTKLSVHEGEEIYLVHRGRAKFYLNDEVYEVEEGSSVYIAPGTRHRAENAGQEDLILYWVNSPPVFGEPGAYKDIVKNWIKIR
jgi:mannose-6-phosphate isomerase-like protein (cupin superfamily)